jgi:xylan 1,4-beta-xylosidase
VIRNPVLPGFNPDPSITRVGNDYYLATSTFVWQPGIRLFHSTDLATWSLIGHGLQPEAHAFAAWPPIRGYGLPA